MLVFGFLFAFVCLNVLQNRKNYFSQ